MVDVNCQLRDDWELDDTIISPRMIPRLHFDSPYLCLLILLFPIPSAKEEPEVSFLSIYRKLWRKLMITDRKLC